MFWHIFANKNHLLIKLQFVLWKKGHRRVDSSQGLFIVGSIHCRVMSTENLIETWNFLAGHTKLCWISCTNFFLVVRHHWNASYTVIYLNEMFNFCSDHENWVHLVVKSFSSLPGATEKLVLQKSTWLKM
jgi:hypothetical protein